MNLHEKCKIDRPILTRKGETTSLHGIIYEIFAFLKKFI